MIFKFGVPVTGQGHILNCSTTDRRLLIDLQAFAGERDFLGVFGTITTAEFWLLTGVPGGVSKNGEKGRFLVGIDTFKDSHEDIIHLV